MSEQDTSLGTRSADVRLRVRDLSVSLPAAGVEGRVTVVDGVSFDIHAGETVALVGESGAGKSMTAAAIVQLLPDGAVSRGAVNFEGSDLLAEDERGMQRVRGRRIGFVFQDPSTALNPMYTIGAHVTEAVKLASGVGTRAAREAARSALERVGFPNERFDAFPHELSGGQKQRAMLAVAIAGDPGMLIADEPTTALDVIAAANVRRLLAYLGSARSLSMLLISHDLPLVAELADRVVVLYAGEVVECGSTRAVLDAPAHPYTRALLACLPPANPPKKDALRKALPVIPPATEIVSDGCRFAPRCGDVMDACRTTRPRLVPTTSGEARCLRVAPEDPR